LTARLHIIVLLIRNQKSSTNQKLEAMKKSLLLIAALLMIVSGILANPIQKAGKKMSHCEYTSAVRILEKAVSTPLYHDQAIPMIAECYRLQNDPVNAEKWYSQAITLKGAQPEWYYFEAQALRSTGQYESARDMFLYYASLRPDDPRGKQNAAFCDNVLSTWKYKTPGFDVKTVTNVNSPEGDFGPAFYGGNLVFASERRLNMDQCKYGWDGKGYVELVNTRPNAPEEYWGEMKEARMFGDKFNKSSHDGPAVFYGNDLVYFTRTCTGRNHPGDQGQKKHYEIYYASFADGKWGALQPFFLNSPDYSVGCPTLSSDGNTVVFVSDMPGGFGGTDLWMCRLQGGKWGQPVNMGADFNTSGNEIFPSIQSNGTLMFSSDGLPGFGGQDIFAARTGNSGWLTPENAGVPLNSSFDDFGINYAPNSQSGFFSSNRPGGMGSYDIYAFRNLEVNTEEITKLTEKRK
jgi:tetratricopeptide (TPR) repeat protein